MTGERHRARSQGLGVTLRSLGFRFRVTGKESKEKVYSRFAIIRDVCSCRQRMAERAEIREAGGKEASEDLRTKGLRGVSMDQCRTPGSHQHSQLREDARQAPAPGGLCRL